MISPATVLAYVITNTPKRKYPHCKLIYFKQHMRSSYDLGLTTIRRAQIQKSNLHKCKLMWRPPSAISCLKCFKLCLKAFGIGIQLVCCLFQPEWQISSHISIPTRFACCIIWPWDALINLVNLLQERLKLCVFVVQVGHLEKIEIIELNVKSMITHPFGDILSHLAHICVLGTCHPKIWFSDIS